MVKRLLHVEMSCSCGCAIRLFVSVDVVGKGSSLLQIYCVVVCGYLVNGRWYCGFITRPKTTLRYCSSLPSQQPATHVTLA